eukprot:6020615-Amphidinium_carterae.1
MSSNVAVSNLGSILVLLVLGSATQLTPTQCRLHCCDSPWQAGLPAYSKRLKLSSSLKGRKQLACRFVGHVL